MNTIKATDSELEATVKSSFSMTEVLTKLGYRQGGSSHQWIRQRIRNLGISTEHFVRKPQYGPRPTQDRLRLYPRRRRVHSYVLRRAMLKAGLEYKCTKCGLQDSWHGNPLKLEVDHINDQWEDCRKENLQFLCPNCHSQKPIRFRNGKEVYDTAKFVLKEKQPLRCYCQSCAQEIPRREGKPFRKLKYCEPCSKKVKSQNLKSGTSGRFKIRWPSDEELLKLLQIHPMTHVSKMIGVSDQAIKKHLLRNGQVVPTRGRGGWTVVVRNNQKSAALS